MQPSIQDFSIHSLNYLPPQSSSALAAAAGITIKNPIRLCRRRKIFQAAKKMIRTSQLEETATVSDPPSISTIDMRGRCWHTILLIILQACQAFIAAATNNPKNGSHQDLTVSNSQDRDIELTRTANPTSSPEVVGVNAYSDSQNVSVDNDKLQIASIANIIKVKDFSALHDFGGKEVFAEALGTDLETGIPATDEDICCRLIACPTSSTSGQAAAIGFVQLVQKHCNNCIIFLLLAAAVLSICFGIIEEGPSTGWFEGLIIFNVIILLVVLPSIRELWRETRRLSWLQKPLEKRELELVDVLRGGNEKKIPISEVLLGEIVCLKRGHEVPADGLFISGELRIDLEDGLRSIVDANNPFLFYGAKVINGNGRMLVTSVGAKTVWGELTSNITHLKKTQLQAQLEKVNTCIQIIGVLMSILLLVVLFLRFEFKKEQDMSTGSLDFRGKPTKIKEFMDAIKKIVRKPNGKISILTTSLTVMLVGIREGLPIYINLAIIYWNRKALKGMASPQDLLACVTTASVTRICTDKNGGLTLGSMEVDTCWIGEEVIAEDSVSVIAPHVLEALCEGISTLLLRQQAPNCTSIEDPLFSWPAMKLGKKLEIVRQSTTIVDDKELTIDQEGRGVLIRKKDSGKMYLHCRGRAKSILSTCSHYHDRHGMKNTLDEQKRVAFQKNVEFMQSQHLKTMAFAYKPTDVPTIEEKDLILLGLVGLKKSPLEKKKESIKALRKAGVNIILVSGDDVEMLMTIALQFGICLPNSNVGVITGEKFRNCTHEERMKMVSKIAVMGNSLPSDKLLLVKCLKEKGDTVAVLGVETNEAPALKEADVGLALGAWSTKMAKVSSDIIVWDADISCLAPILCYGRCTYYKIQKYIQLELTTIVAGLLVTFIIAACTGNMPITAIQLSWVNLVVPMLGGLALLTELPRKKLMKKPQFEQTKGLITKAMWRNIMTQALYQVVTIVTFQFKGEVTLGINEKVCKTIIFNSFVICQIFNKFIARELVMKNVFKAIHKNQWFWVALTITILLQGSFIEISHLVVGDARLTLVHWGICLVIGMVSLAMDFAAKCIYGFMIG